MRVAAILVAAVALASCGARDRSPIVVERRIEAEGALPATVRVRLQREHQALANRYLDAAAESVRVLRGWSLLDEPIELTLVDPPWRGSAAAERGSIALERTPWWTTPSAMSPELAVSRALARHAIVSAFDARALPPWFVNGASEYIARQITMGLFARDANTPGYAMYEARYFGGLVPRFVWIRLLPESDGDPIPSYRRHPSADPADAQADAASLSAKTVLVLVTLERWVSRPVLEAAIAELVTQFRGGRPTLSDVGRVVSAVSGQDLSWLLVQTFGSAAVFDYGVGELVSRPSSTGAFDTTVTVVRRGDGLFTGATPPRVGRFESGRGLTLAVTFADGEEVRETWDGRDERKRFDYRSRARAMSATIDPDRVIALDVKRVDNSRTLDPRTETASRRWAARWLLWIEQLLVTYGALA